MLSLFSSSSSHLLVTLHCKRNLVSLQSVLHKRSLFFVMTDGMCLQLHGTERTRRCIEQALPSKVNRNRIILIQQAKVSEKRQTRTDFLQAQLTQVTVQSDKQAVRFSCRFSSTNLSLFQPLIILNVHTKQQATGSGLS